MIAATLDAIGRHLALGGPRRSAALLPYARVLRIAIPAIRTEADVAAFAARAAAPRPGGARGGVRWILSGAQRSAVLRMEDLRQRAARLALHLAGDAPERLVREAAEGSGPGLRALIAAGRGVSSGALGAMSLPALLAVLAYAVGREADQ